MTSTQLTKVPIATAELLIRRPAEQVFAAFVDPKITTRFWFTDSSGPLAQGQRVRWAWSMYDLTAEITVKVLEPHRRIVIEWPGSHGPTRVEWQFSAYEDGMTFVRIENTGFGGTADQQVEEAIDAAGGFALVLAGLKAVLEHDIELQLVRDRFAPSQSKPCAGA